MARYPHAITITRQRSDAAQGTMVAGVWVPTPGVDPVAIYSGPADVQDAPKALARDADGISTITADATVYLPGVPASIVQPEDHCVVAWGDGTTDDARVMETRRLDDRIALEWL